MRSIHIKTTCCISGGGPAGMMTGFLLARAGIEVLVLEKHADFFRDFRGDTIHPSTFELIHELGILDEFLALPHQEQSGLGAVFNDRFLKLADFSHLPVAKPALGFMPQWDFLNFLKTQGEHFRNFHLMMNVETTDLLKGNGKICGVKAETAEGVLEIQADLVIAADGRHSLLREKAGLKVIVSGVPIDVLWFKLSKQKSDPGQALGFFRQGKLTVMLDRNDYWQCGYVIPKGDFDKIKENGLSYFGTDLSAAVPFLKDRVHELIDWDQIKLLSVEMDHLEKWYDEGLLCIGDAVHAMSPVGGVGINLAIQDAVATANILYPSLKEKIPIDTNLLQQVQKRREYPTRVTQRIQRVIQNGIINRRQNRQKQNAPLLMRMLDSWPLLRRIPARLIGMGIRTEHIKTPYIK